MEKHRALVRPFGRVSGGRCGLWVATACGLTLLGAGGCVAPQKSVRRPGGGRVRAAAAAEVERAETGVSESRQPPSTSLSVKKSAAQSHRRHAAVSSSDDEAAPPTDTDGNERGPRAGQTKTAARKGKDRGAPAKQDSKTALSRIKRMIIYSAVLRISVVDVDEAITQALALIDDLGGYMQSRRGGRLIVRVPAERFRAALEELKKVGDVYGRKIWTEDVTRQYMDLKIRLKASLAVLARLKALLQKTKNVKEALAVEREMARVVEKIERLKGRIRYLEQHVSLSTITIRFVTPRGRYRIRRPKARKTPFRWLRRVGIRQMFRNR